MTPQERIAALELSNQRMKTALEHIAEDGCNDCPQYTDSQLVTHLEQIAGQTLSSSKPSKVVEVLRQCEDALRMCQKFKYDHDPKHVDLVTREMPSLFPKVDRALAALREILG